MFSGRDSVGAMGNGDATTLARAFAQCDEITREHSKSFYFSTAFLPVAKRRAIRAFYAFCRLTDDIVDHPRPCMAEALQQWRLDARQSADKQTHPVLFAWAKVRDAYAVPHHYIEELIDGCEMDLSVSRYRTWAELEKYCYCVASTVGLVSMHIIGLTGPQHAAQAITHATGLGIALQLTNVLRDVAEDHKRGRIYLPQEDMQRFGYSEDDLRHSVNDTRFKQLMRFEMDRADALYDEHLHGLVYLNNDGRLAVGAAAMLYRYILGKIHLHNYDVFNHRAHLTNREKIVRMPRIAFQVMRMTL